MIFLPDLDWDATLSRWTGRPHGLTIDPIGVECFAPVAEPKRGWFGRRRDEPTASPYVHVLAHRELGSDRIRAWASGQVAQLAALSREPDATGQRLTELTEAEAARLAGRDWTPASLTVDGVAHPGSAYVDTPERWAAYVEVGEDRIALIGRDVTLDAVALRTASGDEARRLRTDALRV